MYNQTQVKTQEKFYNELKTRFPKDNIIILEYEKASGPIKYQCLQCGEVYTRTKANKLYENKTLCNKCNSGKTSALKQTFLKRIQEDGFELLDIQTKPINQKFHIKCLKCGREYDYKIQQTILHSNLNCRYCGINGYIVSEDQYKDRMLEKTRDFELIHYKKITSSAVFQHNECGYIFSRLPNNFLNNPTCPKCKPKHSKGEQKIYDWLTFNNIIFEEQKKFEELNNLSYDFFLPEFKLLIEYQGEQHIRPIKYFGGQEKFLIQQQHDQIKRNFALKNKYTLLEIFYYEYEQIENILESSTTR